MLNYIFPLYRKSTNLIWLNQVRAIDKNNPVSAFNTLGFKSRCKYHPAYFFIPLPVKTFGGWHPTIAKLIARLGRELSRSPAGVFTASKHLFHFWLYPFLILSDPQTFTLTTCLVNSNALPMVKLISSSRVY